MFQGFAGDVARHFSDDHDRRNFLETRFDPRVDPVAKLVRIEIGCTPRDDGCNRRFSPLVRFDAEYGNVQYLFVLARDRLDVLWIDVDSTGNDQVFFPSGEIQETVFVDVAEIAGVQPAVAKGFPGQLRLVVIA